MKKLSLFDELGKEIFLHDVLEPGDTVYYYQGDFMVVLDYKINYVSVTGSLEKGFSIKYEASCYYEEGILDDIDFYGDDIGKTVFLSEEECSKEMLSQDI